MKIFYLSFWLSISFHHSPKNLSKLFTRNAYINITYNLLLTFGAQSLVLTWLKLFEPLTFHFPCFHWFHVTMPTCLYWGSPTKHSLHSSTTTHILIYFLCSGFWSCSTRSLSGFWKDVDIQIHTIHTHSQVSWIRMWVSLCTSLKDDLVG